MRHSCRCESLSCLFEEGDIGYLQQTRRQQQRTITKSIRPSLMAVERRAVWQTSGSFQDPGDSVSDYATCELRNIALDQGLATDGYTFFFSIAALFFFFASLFELTLSCSLLVILRDTTLVSSDFFLFVVCLLLDLVRCLWLDLVAKRMLHRCW